VAAIAALTVITATACSGTVADDGGDAETFYQGKTVEIIVPYGPGGSNDAAARLLAPLLAEYVPGKPRVQVVNVEGGGTVIGSNKFENAPHDGLTWFVGGASVTDQYIFGNPDIEYSMSDWTPLVGFPQGQVAYASTALGIDSASDLLDATEPLVMATQDTDSGSLAHIVALKLLGVDFQLVSGYADTGAKRVAVLTGEANVNGESTIGYLQYDQPEVDNGNAFPLYAFGFPNADGGLDRDPSAPDIPTVAEVYEELYGEQPSGELWDLFLGLLKPRGEIQKALFIHSDAPPAAIEALTQGLEAMKDDPDYAKGIEDVLEGYQPVFGDHLAEVYESIVSPQPGFADDVLAFQADVNEALASKGGQIEGGPTP
jgi:tripartite-type tricarboxylate transporter receptor subunit TctC